MPLGGPSKETSLADYILVTEGDKKKFEEQFGGVIEGNIPVRKEFRGKILEIYSVDRSNYTHGFHKFPAKYIPEIPRWGIFKFSKEGDTVLDPFCGSGTTNVEARLHERNSYAIDVDPIASLLTKVKTTPLDEGKLRKEKDRLVRAIYSTEAADIPEFPNRDYWFKPEVLHDLAIITKCINSIDEPSIRDFFLVCFSSILKQTSNADSKFLYALAISRKMREQTNRKIDAKGMFVQRVKDLTPRMIQSSKICSIEHFVKIIGKDARDIDLPNESIGLAVTSPPYCNAVDYPRAHQLQIYWLGLWKGKLSDLKKSYIGTEQVPADEYSHLHTYGNSKIDNILEKIYGVDRRRSYVVYRYFTDMKKNFLEVKRVLKPGGHYVVAVADNIVRKIPVPTHDILMDIGREVGFEVEDHYGSVLMMRPHNMREKEKMCVEWVMAFRKD